MREYPSCVVLGRSSRRSLSCRREKVSRCVWHALRPVLRHTIYIKKRKEEEEITRQMRGTMYTRETPRALDPLSRNFLAFGIYIGAFSLVCVTGHQHFWGTHMTRIKYSRHLFSGTDTLPLLYTNLARALDHHLLRPAATWEVSPWWRTAVRPGSQGIMIFVNDATLTTV